MNSFSFYDSSVPHATAALDVLLHLLDKIEAHSTISSIPADALIRACLAPDMRPLSFQVFVACDAAMQIASRCQGIQPIVWDLGPDGLNTINDLRTRVHTTRDFVQNADRQKFVDSEADVAFNMAPGKYVTAKAREFVNGFALPNMYFHIVTMYNILRNHNVQIGKMDYLDYFLGRYMPQQVGATCKGGNSE